jgi:hypothetical protein
VRVRHEVDFVPERLEEISDLDGAKERRFANPKAIGTIRIHADEASASKRAGYSREARGAKVARGIPESSLRVTGHDSINDQ